MNLGNNISFLRKKKKLTQEQFAEMMEVTRQTVSRWETDEVVPELDRLEQMCSVFACTMDDLVRKDLTTKENIYSSVEVRKLPAFRMARYVIISANPECDVMNYMMNWGKTSGLLAACPGVEYATNNEAEYAVITVTDPHVRSFERIPGGYQRIMEYLQAGNFKERFPENVIPCFEYEYDKDGVHYMDIFIHTDSVIRGKS